MLGPDHPDTLNDRANFGYWTGKAGDPTGARDLFTELLPMTDRVLGPEHPVTLRARGYLARWTGETGDPAGARDQFQQLLPVIEQVLAPSTRTPGPPAVTSPTGPERPATRPVPATSFRSCWPSARRPSALSTRTP